MQKSVLRICILIGLLIGCIPATATPTSELTAYPDLPAAITASALPSQTPTNTPTSMIVSQTPENSLTPSLLATLEPTITETIPPLPTVNLAPTLTATSLPQPVADSSAIQFYGPGPLSKLVSSVPIYGYAVPGFNHRGYVSLYGENGRLLVSDVLQLNTAFTWAYFNWSLLFEIQTAGELARLTMSTLDEYGRLTAVNSVHLILLSAGYSIINPPGSLKERCIIEKPGPGFRISNGLLAVYGEMRPFNSLPLVVELVGRDGKVITSQLVAITPDADDRYVPFQVDLAYSISRGTYARLAVSQQDDRIGGTMYLYSREVFLNP
jgi:hypothetical protein